MLGDAGTRIHEAHRASGDRAQREHTEEQPRPGEGLHAPYKVLLYRDGNTAIRYVSDYTKDLTRFDGLTTP